MRIRYVFVVTWRRTEEHSTSRDETNAENVCSFMSLYYNLLVVLYVILFLRLSYRDTDWRQYILEILFFFLSSQYQLKAVYTYRVPWGAHNMLRASTER